jgi:apolipoprotein D and lipocalin family protein
MILRPVAAAIGALLFAACASSPAPHKIVRAPQPAKSIDAAKFYTGRWYEIARTPMSLTDGCVAGSTDWVTDGKGKLVDHDECRDKTPTGKIKQIEGPAVILDPGTNTKVDVHYKVFWLFTITRTYWIVERADDYSWYIASDPELENINAYTRDPRPSKTMVDMLTERTKALGYDVAKLEYPEVFPPGMK